MRFVSLALKLTEITKKISENWKVLSEDKKQVVDREREKAVICKFLGNI